MTDVSRRAFVRTAAGATVSIASRSIVSRSVMAGRSTTALKEPDGTRRDEGTPVGGATVCPDLGDTFRLESGSAYRNGQQLSVSERSDPESFFVVPTIWWGFDRRDEYTAVCREIVERFGDMRRFGSAQFELGLCAAGAVEAVVTNVRANPWDTVLGVGLVRAAGGTVTDINGNPWRHDSRGLVASNGRAHDAVLDAVREIVAED